MVLSLLASARTS